MTRRFQEWRLEMEAKTTDFSVDVQGIKGLCPVGEVYANEQIAARTTPVLSCEGPCIRGDIARRAADLVVQDVPSLMRACHGESFFVPYSAMAAWVRSADRVLMIDGCFLQCHGRILKNLIRAEQILQVDAMPLYKKYSDVFLMDDVPEKERKAVSREVADKIIARLKQAGAIPPGSKEEGDRRIATTRNEIRPPGREPESR
jgi:uncharacterized metal-binding protein